MSGVTQGLIVTAADQLFWRALAQLLLSAERKGDHRRYGWVIYDLGIDADRLAFLHRRFGWADWRQVEFASLPDHYRPATRSFAWKPLIVWDVLETATVSVLWMDSATVIRGDLAEVFDWIRTHGAYAARGRTEMAHRCEPVVMDRLEFPPDLAEVRERVANFVGFDPAHPAARKVAQDWERLSRDPDLLLPPVQSVEKHMNDQAVLNCLLLKAEAENRLKLPKVDMDISAGRPIKMVSTRNKVPPWVPLWADPFVRFRYWLIKSLDQAAWRWTDRRNGK